MMTNRTKNRKGETKRFRTNGIFYELLGTRQIKASMSLEACMVLPLFLFAFVNLMSIIELYRVESNLEAAMHHTAKELAVYAGEYKMLTEQEEVALPVQLLTGVYAASQVTREAGEEYLDHSPIQGGSQGISWLSSRIMKEDECIDLVASYRVGPLVSLMGFGSFRVNQRVRTRAWTGYDVTGANDLQTEEALVYITPNGTAYHASPGCRYLALSIRAVLYEQIAALRNEDDAKYYVCESCGRGSSNTVFITRYGNKYHSTLRCSALKRTIEMVPLSKVGERTACKGCCP